MANYTPSTWCRIGYYTEYHYSNVSVIPKFSCVRARRRKAISRTLTHGITDQLARKMPSSDEINTGDVALIIRSLSFRFFQYIAGILPTKGLNPRRSHLQMEHFHA